MRPPGDTTPIPQAPADNELEPEGLQGGAQQGPAAVERHPKIHLLPILSGFFLLGLAISVVAGALALVSTPQGYFGVSTLGCALFAIAGIALHLLFRDPTDRRAEDAIANIGRFNKHTREAFPPDKEPRSTGPINWTKLIVGFFLTVAAGLVVAMVTIKLQGGTPPQPATPYDEAKPQATIPAPEAQVQIRPVPRISTPDLTRDEWFGVIGEVNSVTTELAGRVAVQVDGSILAKTVAQDGKVKLPESTWWPCVTRSSLVIMTLDRAEAQQLHAAFLADFRDLANCQRAKADELSPAQHVPAQGIRLSSETGQTDTYETKPVLGGERAQDFDLQMGIIIEALGPQATIGVEAYGVGFQWIDDGQGPSITGWKPKPNSKEFEPFRQDLDLRRPWVDEKLILRVRRHGTEVRFYVGTIEVASGRVPPDIFHCDNRSLKFSVRDARIVLQSALVFGIESERLFKPQIEELKTRFKNTVNSPLTPKTLAHAAPG